MQNTRSGQLAAEVTRLPGTGWSGLRVWDPEQEASWPDLTADEGALLQLAYRLQRTGVAGSHLQDLIDDLLA